MMRDGLPLSWRHFWYGLAALGRALASEALRTAGAVGVSYMKSDDARAWKADHKKAAGLVWGR